MNHTRIAMVLSDDKFAEVKEHLAGLDISQFDFLDDDNYQTIFLGFRCWPKGLRKYIGDFVDNGDALLTMGDDVGNSPIVYYKDIEFILPSAMDEDQDTVKMTSEMWGKLQDMLRAMVEKN